MTVEELASKIDGLLTRVERLEELTKPGLGFELRLNDLDAALAKANRFSIKVGAELNRLQKVVLEMQEFIEAMSDDLTVLEQQRGLTYQFVRQVRPDDPNEVAEVLLWMEGGG